MSKSINITLDGPSGSGKTTIAKAIAKDLNYIYVDTGGMYRGVAWFVDSRDIDATDEQGVVGVLPELRLDIKVVGGEQHVFVNGQDVSGQIRTPKMSQCASIISTYKDVRHKLVSMQREIARSVNSVFDGRDMGSYVLPFAEYKFYLTADIDERAKRRYLELKDKGQEVAFEDVKQDMIERDERDSSRAFAPLVIPTGAFVIDTTNLTIEEVKNIILNKIGKLNKD